MMFNYLLEINSKWPVVATNMLELSTTQQQYEHSNVNENEKK